MAYYLEHTRTGSKLPDSVALSAFVKTSGDTVGVVYINIAGGFSLWHEGSCIGTFDTLKALYAKLDQMGV